MADFSVQFGLRFENKLHELVAEADLTSLYHDDDEWPSATSKGVFDIHAPCSYCGSKGLVTQRIKILCIHTDSGVDVSPKTKLYKAAVGALRGKFDKTICGGCFENETAFGKSVLADPLIV